MSKAVCPGQDTRFWKPEDIFDIECAGCGRVLEFFRDDASRICSGCGERVTNPKVSLGCAQWCEHAKKCLGYDPKEVGEDNIGGVDSSLTDRLIAAVRKEFGDDAKRIEHALNVYNNARALLKDEPGDPRVVFSAALLHDIGIVQAEKIHGSNAGKYQELEGPPIAERIMKELDLDVGTIEHVKRIVANHHSAKDIDTPEFRIIWDSDWLVNIPDEYAHFDKTKLADLVEKVFKTPTGKAIAEQKFLVD